jgi:hypothetical protein
MSEECVICFEEEVDAAGGLPAPLAACQLDSSRGRCACTTPAHPACASNWARVRAECPVCGAELGPIPAQPAPARPHNHCTARHMARHMVRHTAPRVVLAVFILLLILLFIRASW